MRLQRLQAVTGAPLRVLGMYWADLSIGNDMTCRKYIPVVPDSYLMVDIMLGCDILSQSTLTWDGKKGTMRLGGASHVVSHIRKDPNKVERVRDILVVRDKADTELTQLNLLEPVRLDLYQT